MTTGLFPVAIVEKIMFSQLVEGILMGGSSTKWVSRPFKMVALRTRSITSQEGCMLMSTHRTDTSYFNIIISTLQLLLHERRVTTPGAVLLVFSNPFTNHLRNACCTSYLILESSTRSPPPPPPNPEFYKIYCCKSMLLREMSDFQFPSDISWCSSGRDSNRDCDVCKSICWVLWPRAESALANIRVNS